MTPTRRSYARQHGGRLSVCASRSMNAPSGKKIMANGFVHSAGGIAEPIRHSSRAFRRAEGGWLGVRDDFRTWFIPAA